MSHPENYCSREGCAQNVFEAAPVQGSARPWASFLPDQNHCAPLDPKDPSTTACGYVPSMGCQVSGQNCRSQNQ